MSLLENYIYQYGGDTGNARPDHEHFDECEQDTEEKMKQCSSASTDAEHEEAANYHDREANMYANRPNLVAAERQRQNAHEHAAELHRRVITEGGKYPHTREGLSTDANNSSIGVHAFLVKPRKEPTQLKPGEVGKRESNMSFVEQFVKQTGGKVNKYAPDQPRLENGSFLADQIASENAQTTDAHKRAGKYHRRVGATLQTEGRDSDAQKHFNAAYAHEHAVSLGSEGVQPPSSLARQASMLAHGKVPERSFIQQMSQSTPDASECSLVKDFVNGMRTNPSIPYKSDVERFVRADNIPAGIPVENLGTGMTKGGPGSGRYPAGSGGSSSAGEAARERVIHNALGADSAKAHADAAQHHQIMARGSRQIAERTGMKAYNDAADAHQNAADLHAAAYKAHLKTGADTPSKDELGSMSEKARVASRVAHDSSWDARDKEQSSLKAQDATTLYKASTGREEVVFKGGPGSGRYPAGSGGKAENASTKKEHEAASAYHYARGGEHDAAGRSADWENHASAGEAHANAAKIHANDDSSMGEKRRASYVAQQASRNAHKQEE
jgi:hypothetical protein